MPVVCTWLVLLLGLSGCSEPAPSRSIFGNTDTSDTATSARVARDTPVSLPRDHQTHPAYQLEWWYLTFTLTDTTGGRYGLQYTLFRFSNGQPDNSHWSDGQQWMGHASLHTLDRHFFAERFAAGGVGNAGVSSMPFSAFIDDWIWQSKSEQPFPGILSVNLQQQASAVLTMTTNGPMVMHGNNGFSVKSADETYRSYYYSQPFIQARGTLTIEDKQVEVTGNGWFDHEWTSQLANQDALGWDWFSLHLDNGDKLMAFRMHVNDQPPYITGSYIERNGRASTLSGEQISLRPVSTATLNNRSVPVQWQLRIPDRQIDVQIAPFKPDQYNQARFSYYEGMVDMTGSHSGQGFMELTGY
ncbi:lipocalin-like domain-containing protein [Salinimonas lutimaris]|uniref:lipocalin-like domain-containing protein n=1 Tax=Salinimonas lutimaris TaxID=914153 RepID=UPI001E3A3A09|nr:lipocalin-like domain-containing protein [Salinimonas lutimaris]